MKTTFLTTFVCILLVLSGSAQKETRNNAYAEALGIAGYYSVNYERIQPITPNRSILAGIGVGFSYVERHLDERWKSYPFRLNLCAGLKIFYGEIGINYMLGYKRDYDYRHAVWSSRSFKRDYWFYHIGLRYQSHKRGLFFRGFVFPIKVTPSRGAILYHLGKSFYKLDAEGKKFVLWGGIDIGYSF